jgi:DNA-binding MarR family transcriptional regulator
VPTLTELHPEHQSASQVTDPVERCAASIEAVVPLLMREIRSEMRRAAPAGLSVPLFRALIFARIQPGASLSALAAHLGVTLPTASVAVDKLVKLGLINTDSLDGARHQRRTLRLTAEGERSVAEAMHHTTQAFAERLQSLDASALSDIQNTLALLDTQITTVARQPRR